MQAIDLDFAQVPHFSAGEFPTLATADGPHPVLEFVDAELIRALSRFRARLGAPVTPSPVAAGWIREGGSHGSQHYIGPIRRDEDGRPMSTRLSTAGDVFPAGDIRTAWLTAVGLGVFGGIGVYVDTRGPSGAPQPMLHLDLRGGPQTLWLRDAGGYHYPARGGAALDHFFATLTRAGQ